MKAISLKACYSAPYFGKPPVLPWKVAEVRPYQRCFLNGDMTLDEVGLFVVALAQYGNGSGNGLSGMDKDVLISIITRRDSSVIAGGIAVIAENPEDSIFPGCCCGLEDWREWLSFQEGGCSPWMGHDPSPVFEKTDQGPIKFWWDGELDGTKPNESPDLEMEEAVFADNLKQIERDLLGFLDVLKVWTEHENIAEAKQLIEKVDQTFDIRPEYMRSEWWWQGQNIEARNG